MAEQIRVDSKGNPQVDFVWGGMAPQPNAERDINLDPVLGDHPVYDKGYSGFPSFKTEAVDNAPGVNEDEEPDVVEPGSPRAVSEAGTIKVSGEGVTKSEAEVQKMAEAKKQRDLDSIAEQHGVGFDPAPVADVEAPDRSEDAKLEVKGDDVPTPLDENTVTPAQARRAEAEKKAENDPVRKSVVMTPDEAVKAREADGRAPQEAPLSEPIAPVTPQDKAGQDKVKENHNPDSEPGERVVLAEQTGEVPVDQHPERVADTPAAQKIAQVKGDEEPAKPAVSRKADAKASAARVPQAKADEIKAVGAGKLDEVDPDTQKKDPAKNPEAQRAQGK